MTTPEPEAIDETMHGMGDPADYDDWADETPDREQRLTELVTQLAEYLGLTIGPAEPVVPVTPSATVKLTCNRCGNAVFFAHIRLDPGVTNELYDEHVCMAGASAATG